MSLAIIPARGGSKRIPRKNIRPFRGMPIISYVIKAALRSDCFSEVMVSTDDPEIAEVAESFGAEVPFVRSGETAGDHATTGEVLREVVKEYKHSGKEFETVCCLYPTAVFITPARIREAEGILKGSEECEGIITMVRNPQPAVRAFVVNEGIVEPMLPDYINSRSQDLSETFFDAGQMYWLKTRPFMRTESKTMAFLKRFPLILSEFEAQDINTEDDWKLAELKSRFVEEYPEVLGSYLQE